ncbi:Ribokinase-like protein, partial [Phlyctochytrium arcticum]
GSTGARIWLPPPSSRLLSYVCNIGEDCPSDVHDALTALDITLEKRLIPNEKQPRAWNVFGSDENPGHRSFKFQTPEDSYINHFRVSPEQFPPSWFSSVEYVHLLMSPARLTDWIHKFKTLAAKRTSLPFIVWEPSPDSCTSSHWTDFLQACLMVDVVSPNHEETQSLAKGVSPDLSSSDRPNVLNDLQTLATCLTESVAKIAEKGRRPIFVIRAAQHGCLVVESDEPGTLVPAVWGPDQQDRVKDVTGAGNSFMGGFMVGFARTKDAVEAAKYGAVSASFTVEQIGCPAILDDERAEARLQSLQI